MFFVFLFLVTLKLGTVKMQVYFKSGDLYACIEIFKNLQNIVTALFYTLNIYYF